MTHLLPFSVDPGSPAKMEDRYSRLGQEITDPKSILYVEGLLVSVWVRGCSSQRSTPSRPSPQDAMAALVSDCDSQSLRRNKNIDSFLQRCECPPPSSGLVGRERVWEMFGGQ